MIAISTACCCREDCTYTSNDGRVILLAVVHCHGLLVGSGAEDAAVVVYACCHEFLSVWCICKIGCAGGVYRRISFAKTTEGLLYTHEPVGLVV